MKKSINDFPFFVGAKLRFKGGPVDGLLFPKEIIKDLQDGLVIEITDISENGNPRFEHDLHLHDHQFMWSMVKEEALQFELLNPRPELETKPELEFLDIPDFLKNPIKVKPEWKVKDLHPKDIVVVQAMYMALKIQQRMNNGLSFDNACSSHEYLDGNFREVTVKMLKNMLDLDDNFMQDLTINYNLKGVI